MENRYLEAMSFRHATKEFDDKKVISDNEFDSILNIGRMSPSSFGLEPWRFVIVQNKSLREKLKEFTWGAQGTLPTASHFVIVLARKKKAMLHGSEYFNHMLKDVKQLPEDVQELYGQFYKKFQEEDFKLLESDRTLFDWASKQTYLAASNMMTGAAYMGIDSCPIEGFDATLTEKFLDEELKIDTQEYGASLMLAFGYRNEAPKHEKVRQELDDIISWYN